MNAATVSAATVSAADLMDDPAYAPFKDRLIETTGLAYYLKQEDELAGRIAVRLSALGLDRLSAYLDRLTDKQLGNAEWDALIAELTIGETFFFRHREQFDALRDTVLPALLQRNRDQRRLRIWSAGCATGAEPYSLAILLRRDLAHLTADWHLSIVGTDINRQFLARAQRGEFNDWAFRGETADIKDSCFVRRDDCWALRQEFKRDVSFQYHNLVQHPFPSLLNNLAAFDLILCRNVMIYFRRDIAEQLVGRFHNCLVDGGWLIVGHAEADVELFHAFRTVNAPGAVLYKKAQAHPATETAASPPRLPADATITSKPAPRMDFSTTCRTFAAPPPKLDQAAGSVAKRSAARPASVAERLAQVRAKADQAEWSAAASCCDELLEDDCLNATAHFYRAVVLEQWGCHAEAERSLRRAIYLDRQFALAHYYLGLLLQKQSILRSARLCFRNAIGSLSSMADDQVLPDADGLTAGDLRQLAQSHFDVLNDV